jgi:hypothetical protein
MSPENIELLDGEHEVDRRFSQNDGLEVVLVWNSLINLAYSRVHDHKSGEQFNSIAPENIHPKETFLHPYIYRVEASDA